MNTWYHIKRWFERSKKEIIVWILAAAAGITLAYACRLEAMV